MGATVMFRGRKQFCKAVMFVSLVATTIVVPMQGTASAAPAASDRVAQAGSDASACRYVANKNGVFTLRGCAYFEDYDEILRACDERGDGLRVSAQLYWNGATRASVADSNGADAGCGRRDLAIAEDTAVWVRVCVETTGCSEWVPARS
jgi:hypothetical protein